MAARTGAGSNGHKLVTLSELLALPVPSEEVVIPEYDVKVVLHAVSGTERVRLTALVDKAESGADNVSFMADVVAAALGDGATAEKVSQLPSAVINRLYLVAIRLSGLGDKALAAIEAELKGTPSGDNG